MPTEARPAALTYGPTATAPVPDDAPEPKVVPPMPE